MPTTQTFVIVGASLAGAKAAETLREDGFDGRVVLIGDEAARPYERPPLSKDYLRGEAKFDVAAIHPADFYDQHHIELRVSTTATALDLGSSEVVLSTDERVGYDRLLLATGASPRHLSVPGAELGGVHYLRTVTDSDRLREAINPGRRVVVIGAGWIGAEVAASARQLGADVAMVEQASLPLERVLGPEVGSVYRDLHFKHGVELHLGVGVESLRGAGSVKEVCLADGTILPADVVVAGIGVIPRVELAEDAGLEVENGVLADQWLATSAPGVYVAGDIANAVHPLYGTRIRLEHWSSALNQGPVAAKNMLGEATVYDRVPFFYSDQYDFGMEYRGWVREWDEVVFRGDRTDAGFVAFWIRDGRVQAAMNANVWDVAESIETLLRNDAPVDPVRLADPDVSLSDLAT